MSDKGRKRKAAAPAPKEPKKAKKEGEAIVPASGDCTVCFDKYDEDYGVLGCAHTFCFKCIESWSQQENSCPLCKARFTFIDRITPGVATITEAAASSSSSSSAKKPLKAKRVKIKKRDQRQNYVPFGNPYAGGLHLFNLGLIVPHLFGQNMIFNMMNTPQGLFDDDDDENDDDYNDNDALIDEDNDDDDEDIDNDPFHERIRSILDRGHSSSSAARGSYDLKNRGRGSTNNPIDLSSDEPAASRSHPTSSPGRMQQARRRTVSVPRTSQSSRLMSTEVIDLTGDDDEPSVPASSSSFSATVQAPPAASSSSSAPAPQQQVSIEHDSSMSSQQSLPFVQSSSSSTCQVSSASSVDWLSSQPPLRNSGVFSAGRQERLIGNGRGPRFPADSPSSHFGNLSRLRGHRPAVQQASDNQEPIIPGNTSSSGLSDDQQRREKPARSRRVPPVSFSIPECRVSCGHRAALGTSRVRGSTGSVNEAPVPPIPNTLATSEVPPSSSGSSEAVSTLASSAPRAANPHTLWDGFDA